MNTSPRIQGYFFVAVTLSLCVGLSCDRMSLEDGPHLEYPEDPDPPPPPSDCPPPPAARDLKVKISEVMVQNESVLADENGSFSPWLELYNNTDEEMNLGGIPLSDDLALADKWAIPCIEEAILPPRGYLVIFLDGDTENDTDLHASFSLEVGAQLQLAVNKGSDLFFFDATKLGPDESAGRYPETSSAVAVLSEPTPGQPNKEPAAAEAFAEGQFIRGDANEDGRVNVTDMNQILKVLFQGESPPSCEDRLDSDDSGVVNLSDAIHVGNALFRKGPTFSDPFPARGTDPTPDDLLCPP